MSPLFVVIVIIVCATCSLALQCNVRDLTNGCPNGCPYDFCPKSENDDQIPCEIRDDCPKPSCKCVFNQRRDTSGTCINVEKCPPFPCNRPNEEYVACPYKSDDCRNAPPLGFNNQLPPLFINLMVIQCSPACKCKEGHYRHSGVCVLRKECP